MVLRFVLLHLNNILIQIIPFLKLNRDRPGAGAHRVVTRQLWVRTQLGGMNYYLLIFIFLRLVPRQKRGVEFPYITPASKIRRNADVRSVLIGIKSHIMTTTTSDHNELNKNYN